MSDPTPVDPADIETGAQALDRTRHVIASDGYPSIVIGTSEQDATTVLAAVLPARDDRVRADERARVAEEIADHPGPDPSPAIPAWWAGYREALRDAAAIARSHTTTGEDTDHG